MMSDYVILHTLFSKCIMTTDYVMLNTNIYFRLLFLKVDYNFLFQKKIRIMISDYVILKILIVVDF